MKLKGMQKLDWLMLVLIIVMTIDMDFANLQTIDYVCLVSFAAWIIMLAVRLYIENKN